MKYRIIKHSNGEQVWFTAKIRRFLFWMNVKEYDDTSYFPDDDIVLSEIVKFKSIDDAENYMKKRYSRHVNSISFEGHL